MAKRDVIHKLEVHNVLQRRQRSTKPWPQGICRKHFMLTIKNGELNQYGKVRSLNEIGGERVNHYPYNDHMVFDTTVNNHSQHRSKNAVCNSFRS